MKNRQPCPSPNNAKRLAPFRTFSNKIQSTALPQIVHEWNTFLTFLTNCAKPITCGNAWQSRCLKSTLITRALALLFKCIGNSPNCFRRMFCLTSSSVSILSFTILRVINAGWNVLVLYVKIYELFSVVKWIAQYDKDVFLNRNIVCCCRSCRSYTCFNSGSQIFQQQKNKSSTNILVRQVYYRLPTINPWSVNTSRLRLVTLTADINIGRGHCTLPNSSHTWSWAAILCCDVIHAGYDILCWDFVFIFRFVI